MSDTIAAIATGAQVAAIGIVRLSGPEAITLADRLFCPLAGGPMSAREDRRLVYGELRGRDGALLDLCLCTISRGPNSYTGEDTAEFHDCKNRGLGTAALRMALALGFGALGMETILADSLLSNARSQHVLLKLGFRFTAEDAHFKYYRITREDYLAGKGEKRE